MFARFLVVAAFLCGTASAAGPSLYKCKDSAGNISYQDHVCDGDKVTAKMTTLADTGLRRLDAPPPRRRRQPSGGR